MRNFRGWPHSYKKRAIPHHAANLCTSNLIKKSSVGYLIPVAHTVLRTSITLKLFGIELFTFQYIWLLVFVLCEPKQDGSRLKPWEDLVLPGSAFIAAVVFFLWHAESTSRESTRHFVQVRSLTAWCSIRKPPDRFSISFDLLGCLSCLQACILAVGKAEKQVLVDEDSEKG